MTDTRTTDLKSRWRKAARKHLLGKRIVDVRWMNEDEQAQLDWVQSAVVLILNDGSLWWPSTDDEGNDAGTLFGQGSDGKPITLPVI